MYSPDAATDKGWKQRKMVPQKTQRGRRKTFRFLPYMKVIMGPNRAALQRAKRASFVSDEEMQQIQKPREHSARTKLPRCVVCSYKWQKTNAKA